MVYNYKVMDVDGNEVSLEEYKGKKLFYNNFLKFIQLKFF